MKVISSTLSLNLQKSHDPRRPLLVTDDLRSWPFSGGRSQCQEAIAAGEIHSRTHTVWNYKLSEWEFKIQFLSTRDTKTINCHFSLLHNWTRSHLHSLSPLSPTTPVVLLQCLMWSLTSSHLLFSCFLCTICWSSFSFLVSDLLSHFSPSPSPCIYFPLFSLHAPLFILSFPSLCCFFFFISTSLLPVLIFSIFHLSPLLFVLCSSSSFFSFPFIFVTKLPFPTFSSYVLLFISIFPT